MVIGEELNMNLEEDKDSNANCTVCNGALIEERS